MPSGTIKSSLSMVFTIRPPKIRRADLRKYSWLPDVFRVKDSIIGRIIGPVLTITLFALAVCYAASKGYKFLLTNSIVPLLSVVVGLILVFRNSTSYERYWEGRKAFAGVVSGTRNMSRMIWVNIGPQPLAMDSQAAPSKGQKSSGPIHDHLRRRKVDTLQLCLSFVFTTKHYLRGEDGFNYPDYIGVLPARVAAMGERPNSVIVSREGTASGMTTPDKTRADATKRVRAKRSKQQIADQTTPLLYDHRSIDINILEDASLPLPLLIAHELSRSIYGFRRDGYLETVGPAGLNALTQHISGLVDQLTAMERIANTPIPKSYAIHLKQCVTLYLFALPLTLVHEVGWMTVPLITAIAFTFMGIEGIADEIEMPFGTDDRDLPLDRYCQDLKEEITYMIENLPEGGEGWQGYDDGQGDD